MSLEDVERIMEETREGIEYQQEIDSILSGELTAEDEEAIQAELDAIVDVEDVQLPDVPEPDIEEQLPDVPREIPGEKSKAFLTVCPSRTSFV